MQRIILALVSICMLNDSEGQHFSWAVAAFGVSTGIEFSAQNAGGDILLSMDYFTPDYYPFEKRFVILGAKGDSLDLGTPPQGNVLIAMNKDGHFLYSRSCSHFGTNFQMFGLASLSNGHFVMAYKTEMVPGDVLIFERDGSVSTITQIPSWKKMALMGKNINFDGVNTWTGDALVFAELSSGGEILRISAIRGFERQECRAFEGTSDGGLMISRRENRFEKGLNGYNTWVKYDCIMKINASFQFEWQHDTKEVSNTSLGSYIPSTRAAQANQRIYSIGNMREGIMPQGAPLHWALHPPYPDQAEQQVGLDSYLNCLTLDGQLLWVKYAESSTIFDDVTADRSHVYVSGRMLNTDFVFGIKQDTTSNKKCFISCMDNSGRVAWVKTFHAQQIPTLDADELGHLNAHFHTQILENTPPLILGQDTISKSYHQLIVCGFDQNGEVRWSKSSTVPMASNGIETTKLFHDDCGNVYVAGTMWFILPASYACFDASFVKGAGYGGAPLVAKIQTTIPSENLALMSSIESTIHIPFFDTQSSKEKYQSMINECVPITEPWHVKVMPNPTSGNYQAEVYLSYPAEEVRVELYSAQGDFIKSLFSSDFRTAGKIHIEDNISNLSNGVYLLIVQGRGGAASARLVKTM